MRAITCVLVLSVVICTAAAKKQPTQIDRSLLMDKEWIGARGDYLLITKDTAIVHADGFVHERNEWKLNNDTLVLTDRTWGSDKKEYISEEAFVIEALGADTLVLRSVNEMQERRVEMGYPPLTSGKSRTFVDHKKLITSPFHFQKLFYSCGGGLSACSDVQAGIDSTGTVFYAHKPGPAVCGKYCGTYKGRLSAEQLKRVSDMVNNCVPDRFWPGSGYDDAPGVTYRFYYNNIVKSRFGQSTPYLGQPLALFLDSIPYNVALHKISDSVAFIK